MNDIGSALFPRPRRLAVGGGSGPRADECQLTASAANRLGPEAFELEVSSDRADLRYGDARGLRYGLATFEQMRSHSSTDLPVVSIADRPDFAVRGYMLDISRDRVPIRSTLARLIDVLALARFNQLQLYMEHTFAYRDHEIVWRNASPMTADDLVWLRTRCEAVGIEVVPCQNTFGHFERWLGHDAYRGRAECPDGAEIIPGFPAAPDTLAPTPANARFALDLVHELLGHLPHRRVNICFDEPFQLGKGVSADEAATRTRSAVYVDHLRRILDPLAAEGHEVLFFADVIRTAPELMDDLPVEAVPVAWCYEKPRPPGRPLVVPPAVAEIMDQLGIDLESHAGFAQNVAPLITTGRPFWVAPGTSSWNSFVGRIDNAIGNLLDAAAVGSASGATGYLVTDWGDNGHIQPPSVSYGPALVGGAVSWCLETNRDVDVATVLDRLVFADRAEKLGGAVVELGQAWAGTGQDAFNASPLSAAVFPNVPTFVQGRVDEAGTTRTVGCIEDAMDAIRRSKPTSEEGDVVRAELLTAAGLARHGAWRLLASAGGGAPSAAELHDDIEQLVEQQRASWLARARPGGLADSLAGFEPIRQR